MNFDFTQEVSRDIYKKTRIIAKLGLEAKLFFKEKDYRPGVKEFYIGIICVAPVFDSFFNIRKGYDAKKKSLGYDVKLDYFVIKKANNKEIYEAFRKTILDSLSIVEELKVKDFNLTQFRKDLEQFFEDHVHLEEIENFEL